MTNDEKLVQKTLKQRAKFLITQRFFGMGEEFVVQWLEAEAEAEEEGPEQNGIS